MGLSVYVLRRTGMMWPLTFVDTATLAYGMYRPCGTVNTILNVTDCPTDTMLVGVAESSLIVRILSGAQFVKEAAAIARILKNERIIVNGCFVDLTYIQLCAQFKEFRFIHTIICQNLHLKAEDSCRPTFG